MPLDLIIAGDLNARIGTPDYRNGGLFTRISNPDRVINTNGRRLLEILKRWPEMIITNGLVFNEKKMDSLFTFYRGKLCSQNDLVITNNINLINQLQISDKYVSIQITVQ